MPRRQRVVAAGRRVDADAEPSAPARGSAVADADLEVGRRARAARGPAREEIQVVHALDPLRTVTTGRVAGGRCPCRHAEATRVRVDGETLSIEGALAGAAVPPTRAGLVARRRGDVVEVFAEATLDGAASRAGRPRRARGGGDGVWDLWLELAASEHAGCASDATSTALRGKTDVAVYPRRARRGAARARPAVLHGRGQPHPLRAGRRAAGGAASSSPRPRRRVLRAPAARAGSRSPCTAPRWLLAAAARAAGAPASDGRDVRLVLAARLRRWAARSARRSASPARSRRGPRRRGRERRAPPRRAVLRRSPTA